MNAIQVSYDKHFAVRTDQSLADGMDGLLSQRWQIQSLNDDQRYFVKLGVLLGASRVKGLKGEAPADRTETKAITHLGKTEQFAACACFPQSGGAFPRTGREQFPVFGECQVKNRTFMSFKDGYFMARLRV